MTDYPHQPAGTVPQEYPRTPVTPQDAYDEHEDELTPEEQQERVRNKEHKKKQPR